MKNDLKTGDLLKHYSYGKLVDIVMFIEYYKYSSSEYSFRYYCKNGILWNYKSFIKTKINNRDPFSYIKISGAKK